jgi:lipopolysaccharide export system permease protein
MNRLSTYLVRLFFRQTLALLIVMLGLLLLFRCLAIFDIVAGQGQNLWTLIGQALLGMPPFAIVITNVCMGIGMARALGMLQRSHELHIIHANRQLGAMFGGIAAFALIGAIVVLMVSNFVGPWASRALDNWGASVAADIVGRTLTPHRFSQVVPGVTVVIGGREGTGNLTDFFTDDRRDPEMRRSYIAKTAHVAADSNGYVLEMHDGAIQYLSPERGFSEISFKTYDIGLEKLTQPIENRDDLGRLTTSEIVAKALPGGWSADAVLRVVGRMAEGFRVISMCLFMGAIAGFPHARRGRTFLPMELVPLLVAYVDKTITSNLPVPELAQQVAGPTAVLLAGLVLLGFRLRLVRLPRFRRQTA